MSQPPCCLTVDVEDWYQSCVDPDVPISDRVVRNTHRVLALLDEAGVQATFFVQGLVAEAFPELVAEIAAQGHEIASHGHTHRSLLELNREELRDELRRAQAAIEDACGVRPAAFRAPDFSITEANLWALEVLAECGVEVDSSIFPMRMRRYGIDGWDPAPQHVPLPDGGTIVEAPVAVWPLGPARLPVGGGGYWRLLPGAVLERAIAAVRAAGRPAILYCHPYEFNPDETREYRGMVPARRRLSQGVGRGAAVARLTRALATLPFARLDAALAEERATAARS
jgi:polysaccharide deacetylase family protein (PEP-CTERM system associated)